MLIKGFCPAPFVSQAVWADGRVSICCNEFGEYEKDFKKEFKSQRRIEIQESFKNNIVPKNCENCFNKYNISGYGLIKIYQNIYGNSFEDIVDVNKPNYIHFSGSNRCNLACKMCNNYASDMFARTYNNISFKKSYLSNDPIYYLNYLNEIINDLEYYTFHGGEPMRDDNFEKIVEILYKKKDNVKITLITNGTSINAKKRSIVDLFKDFKHVRIMMSLDSIKSVNDYTRTFTDTNKVIQNYNYYVENLPNVKMAIHSVISNLTLLYLDKFIDFILSNELVRIDEVSYYILDNPKLFKIETLPYNYVQSIKKNILKNNKLKQKIAESKFEKVYNKMFKEISYRLSIQSKEEIKLWPVFLKHSRELDSNALIATDGLTNLLVNP